MRVSVGPLNRNGGQTMRPLAREALAERIERLRAIDPVAGVAQKAVRKVVPQGTRFKDALSGTWLGHPVHPPITDLVVGSWTSAWLLDLLGGKRSRPAADKLVVIGVVAAVPTALTGLSDWADTAGGTRRVGVVHALGNTTALTLHVLSWRARRDGRRLDGVALSTLGMAAASFSAWLGGHLSYSRGVGVNQTAFDEPPQEWTPVAADGELLEGRMVSVPTDEMNVLLVRRHGVLHAIDDRCSHRGCSLAQGTLGDGTVTCACHGSTFRLDGSVVNGPATSPQPRLDARVRDGRVEVRAPER
jgi:nitrite reductase/ring-hydroxylating ferredoxin subunit/uncharacterized membrane protein